MKNIKYCFLLFAFYIHFLIPSLTFSQWVWQNPLPQGNRLYDINYINQNTGWACGEDGTIIKTTDGGNNWNFQQFEDKKHLWSTYFLNEYTGFVAGEGGNILKTTNGGINFFKVALILLHIFLKLFLRITLMDGL